MLIIKVFFFFLTQNSKQRFIVRFPPCICGLVVFLPFHPPNLLECTNNPNKAMGSILLGKNLQLSNKSTLLAVFALS